MNTATPTTPTEAFYTIPELQERWSIARTTIYREIQRGRLKRSHIGGGVRFSAAEIERYEKCSG